jgi:hypothetical protein
MNATLKAFLFLLAIIFGIDLVVLLIGAVAQVKVMHRGRVKNAPAAATGDPRPGLELERGGGAYEMH